MRESPLPDDLPLPQRAGQMRRPEMQAWARYQRKVVAPSPDGSTESSSFLDLRCMARQSVQVRLPQYEQCLSKKIAKAYNFRSIIKLDGGRSFGDAKADCCPAWVEDLSQ